MVAVSGDLVTSCFATITKNCSLEHYNNFFVFINHHYRLATVYVFVTQSNSPDQKYVPLLQNLNKI